jgi:hypothetical protein
MHGAILTAVLVGELISDGDRDSEPEPDALCVEACNSGSTTPPRPDVTRHPAYAVPRSWHAT